MPEGVLSDRELRAAVRDGWIAAADGIDDRQFQPASLDLRLGPQAYQLRASFLPFRETVQGRLGDRGLADSDLVIDQFTLTGAGATLQRGSVYLIPLLESLALPEDVRGRSNPKSTTGRLDIFTRVITDATPRFDEIRAGYRGALYLEVSPQSFPVRVQIGASRYAFSGKLSLDCLATNLLPRSKTNALTLHLRIGTNSETDQVFGDLSDGTWLAGLSGDRAKYNAQQRKGRGRGRGR